MGCDAFISYAREDQQACDQIHQRLQSGGLSCWVAPKSIKPSTKSWRESVVKGINGCRVFLLVVSTNANGSENVKDELEQAKHLQKQIVVFFLHDVQLCGDFELALRRLQWLNDFDAPLEARVELLVEAIRGIAKKRTRRVPTAKSNGAELGNGAPEAATARSHTEASATANHSQSRQTAPSCRGSDWDNPYSFSAVASSATFKGRKSELDDLCAAIEGGGHCAVYGLQRVGKTSLVEEGLKERFAAAGRHDSIIFVKVDVQKLGKQVKYRELLEKIIKTMGSELERAGVGQDAEGLRGPTNELLRASNFGRGDRTELFDRIADVLMAASKISKRRIILFLDEFSELRESLELARKATVNNPRGLHNVLIHDLYIDQPFVKFLSSLVKTREFSRHVSLIVSVRPFMAEYDELADLQLLKLMQPVSVYYLDERASKELICEPLEGKFEFEDGLVERLWKLTSGHPYLLQFMMRTIADRVVANGESMISHQRVNQLVEQMTSDGPAYNAQFHVLISDYSIAEVSSPQEAQIGEGALGVIAEMGGGKPDRWALRDDIVTDLEVRGIPTEKTVELLDQLSRTKIVEEANVRGDLCYRIFVPLLQQRLMAQHFHLKGIPKSKKGMRRPR